MLGHRPESDRSDHVVWYLECLADWDFRGLRPRLLNRRQYRERLLVRQHQMDYWRCRTHFQRGLSGMESPLQLFEPAAILNLVVPHLDLVVLHRLQHQYR